MAECKCRNLSEKQVVRYTFEGIFADGKPKDWTEKDTLGTITLGRMSWAENEGFGKTSKWTEKDTQDIIKFVNIF